MGEHADGVWSIEVKHKSGYGSVCDTGTLSHQTRFNTLARAAKRRRLVLIHGCNGSWNWQAKVGGSEGKQPALYEVEMPELPRKPGRKGLKTLREVGML